MEKNVSGDPAHKRLYIGVGVNTPGSTRKSRIALVRVKQLTLSPPGLGSGLAAVYINKIIGKNSKDLTLPEQLQLLAQWYRVGLLDY